MGLAVAALLVVLTMVSSYYPFVLTRSMFVLYRVYSVFLSHSYTSNDKAAC